MAKDRCRNVLMTTMSILLNGNLNVNYYFEKAGKSLEENLFCDGISPLEPGTKYFLSKYLIDEIVVVGSDATINKEDRRKYTDLQEVCVEIDSTQTIFSKGSAYELYKYRIATFLREKGRIGEGYDVVAEEAVAKRIPQKRREELRKLYERECEENIFLVENKKMDGKEHNVWKDIEDAIRTSINEDFLTTDDYRKYLNRLDVIRQYQEEYWKNLIIEGNSERVCEEIRKNVVLSLIEKEYLYRELQKKVIEAKLRNEIVDLHMEITELEMELDRLKYENTNIRTQRQNSELNYVKYIAFCNLPDSNRLYPLAENTDAETHPIALRFVDEQIGEESVDNINGIVNALYGDEQCTEINLYIDMQGGNRTSSYVRNAIVSVLSNQEPAKVHIKEIIGTNFNNKNQQGNEIVNETKRYRILDLVSGMNAFIRYGKADMIQNYCELMNIAENSQVRCLVNKMVEVDDAISLCNTQALVDAIVELRELLSDDEEMQDSVDFVENVFQILRDGIKSDYGKLLEKPKGKREIDYAELISWCARKGFIQQALTLIEDKMPSVYFERGMLSFEFEDDANGQKKEAFANIGTLFEKRIENKLFYSLPKMCIDGPVFELLWHLKPSNVARNLSGRGTQLNELRAAAKKEIKISYPSLVRQEIEHYCNHPVFSVKKEQLEKKIEKLKTKGQDEVFVELYCEFRRMEKDFEDKEDGKRDILVPGTIYDIGKERIKNHSQPVYYSLVGCFGTHEYYSGGKNDTAFAAHITINYDSRLEAYKGVMEEAFTLHEALKLERNCSNHASEKGIRLQSKMVKRAIEIYARDIALLFSIISE